MTHSAYPILDLTFIAAEDLTECQYMLVEFDATEGQVQLHVTENGYPIGILRNKPDTGETAVVRVIGVTEAAIGGFAVRYGYPIGDEQDTSGGAGSEVPTGYIVEAEADNPVFGWVLNASGSTEGDLATIMCNFLRPSAYTALS